MLRVLWFLLFAMLLVYPWTERGFDNSLSLVLDIALTIIIIAVWIAVLAVRRLLTR